MLSQQSADGGVAAKLIDFDFAVVQPRGKLSRVPCGTVPFMAPEVISSSYDGMKADMWSCGVLLVDLGCHLRCVEQDVLGAARHSEGTEHISAWEAARTLRDAFSNPSRVEELIRAE